MTPTSCPLTVVITRERKGRSTSSVTGSASMSARSATSPPGRPPLRMPTTPVPPTPVSTSIPRASRASALEDAHHSRATHTSAHVDPERLQMRRDELRRAHFLTGELRMLVYVATPGDDAVHHRWHAPIDIRRERRCTRLLHNEREEEQRQRHGGQVWGGMISKGSCQRSSVHRTLTPVPRTTLDSVSMSSQPEQSGYYRKGFGLKAEVQPDLAQYEGQVVDYLREHDYTLTVGDVTIRLAHEFGF